MTNAAVLRCLFFKFRKIEEVADMGRSSKRENKNIYQRSREAAGLTREAAAELLECISQERIERIESEKVLPRPEDVLRMARAYKNPSLCNHYCSRECEIGKVHVPEVQFKELSQITLEIIAHLNALTREKDRLVEITIDGEISADERADFQVIREDLEQMSLTIDALKLWVDHAIMSGKMRED